MKTKTLVLSHWEDVVFENRNKSYGAYMLRRAYSQRVILGWGITVALFAGLLYLSDLSLENASEIIKPFQEEPGRPISFEPPPILPERVKPRVEQQPSTARSSQIVVTTDPVETTVEPIQSVTSNTDDTGNLGAIDGSPDGVIAPAIEVPIITQPEPIRDFAEVMPAFSGGLEAMMKYIQSKTRYPASARRMGISGTVYVRFVVGADGNILNVEVIRGISKDCDAEAARVIAGMPKWTAAIQNGVNVPVRMVVPIKFALQQ